MSEHSPERSLPLTLSLLWAGSFQSDLFVPCCMLLLSYLSIALTQESSGNWDRSAIPGLTCSCFFPRKSSDAQLCFPLSLSFKIWITDSTQVGELMPSCEKGNENLIYQSNRCCSSPAISRARWGSLHHKWCCFYLQYFFFLHSKEVLLLKCMFLTVTSSSMSCFLLL